MVFLCSNWSHKAGMFFVGRVLLVYTKRAPNSCLVVRRNCNLCSVFESVWLFFLCFLLLCFLYVAFFGLFFVLFSNVFWVFGGVCLFEIGFLTMSVTTSVFM